MIVLHACQCLCKASPTATSSIISVCIVCSFLFHLPPGFLLLQTALHPPIPFLLQVFQLLVMNWCYSYWSTGLSDFLLPLKDYYKGHQSSQHFVCSGPHFTPGKAATIFAILPELSNRITCLFSKSIHVISIPSAFSGDSVTVIFFEFRIKPRYFNVFVG